MAKRRILTTWIGTADLGALAETLSGTAKKRILEENKRPPREKNVGPVKTLLTQIPFDEVHLISNYSKFANGRFAKWMDRDVKVHSVKPKSPIDYPTIYGVVHDVLDQVTHGRRDRIELFTHLSPGSPAMAAIWVLLGKSEFPATFYQTFNNEVRETDVPFELDVQVREMLRETDLALHHLSSRSPAELGFAAILGESKAIKAAAGRAERAALYEENVLLLGEPGTGKEMFAEAIHQNGRRAGIEFLAVNCAAIPSALLESELFGHEKGAFTNATHLKKGAFERLDGGTIFLDEVGECSAEMQAKLLRVLQPKHDKGPCYREFQRVGGAKTLDADVRLIAATNRNLALEVEKGKFREDLYHRLAHLRIKLPPLRVRDNDVRILAEARLDEVNDRLSAANGDYKHKTFSAGALSFVRGHPWYGNVRELHNAVMQAAVMAPLERKTIEADDLTQAVEDTPQMQPENLLDKQLGGDFSLNGLLEHVQRHYLKRAMDESGGTKTKAARLLGYNNYQTLDKQLERLGVEYE